MFNYKKAEVPIVILVLGVLLLCVIVFVNSFDSFKSLLGKQDKHGNIEEVVNMEACLSYIEQYNFYKNNPQITGYSEEQIRDLPVFIKDGKNLIEGNFLICDSESGSIKIKYPLNLIK